MSKLEKYCLAVLITCLCIMALLAIRDAEAIPIHMRRVTGNGALTAKEQIKAYRICEGVWNKSFRSGGRIRLKDRRRINFPMVGYTIEDWQEGEHFYRAWSYLAGVKWPENVPIIFNFPPLEKDGQYYYAGHAALSGYTTTQPALAVTNLYNRSLAVAGRVMCHELAHVIFGSIHTEGGLMGSNLGAFEFSRRSIVKANRKIRRWNRDR